MTETTSPCTLPHSMPENMSGMKVYSNCDLLKGGGCNACNDYIALEAKISASLRKQALDELLSQRPKMRTRVNQNHDLFTTSVPLEIVCSVFQFCVPEKSSFKFGRCNDPDWNSRNKEMVSAPLLLGSVCRTWRNIAWEIKSLWTLFRLNLDRLQNPNKVALTREWLDRAGQLPLSIHISSHFNRISEPRLEIATQLLALVNERSEQWESLDLVDCQGWALQALARSAVAPNLQTLKLMDIAFATFIGLKPSRLFLHDCELGSISIEWNRLTHVYLSECYLDECIELLRRAPDLVYYRVSGVYEDSNDFPIHDNPILCPNLGFIEFDCLDNEESQAQEIITFFKSFMFPNLKHLKLQTGGSLYDRPNEFLWDPVVAHIVDASPPLISLKIMHPGLHPIRQCILPILQKTPFLRDLEMFAPFDEEWEGEQNEFFNLLANTSILADDHPQTSFLPNLQSIKFYLSDEEEPDRFWHSVSGIFGPISEIHNPRRRPLTTLQVRAEETDELPKDAVLKLLRLQQEGIVIDLKDIDEELDLLEDSIEWHGLG